MHRNARLTPAGRLLLCERIEGGWPVAHAAESMGISRDRAYVWWRRYQAEGVAGLEDRSSRPHRCPTRTKASRERRIVYLRRKRGLGPARIAGIVGMEASTVHAVLVRHGLNRLDHLDRPTRAPIRRMEMSRPGELVHVDIKKLGRIPPGGGWRVRGRSGATHHRRHMMGFAYVHSAVDAYTRLAYSEVLADEQAITAAGFWARAAAFFARLGIGVERVLTDNGPCYRSRDFAAALGGVRHSRTRPYRPQTNGKAERFNRTLLAEWAYARAWRSDGQRTRALTAWLHTYNHHRHHTAVGGPPISRVSNLAEYYI
ncbi:MAG TPA: IS481 family transposase [Micromonosporaceae bacterium]|nr:IS481 family transposase [Micromonosporaceae bacterium]